MKPLNLATPLLLAVTALGLGACASLDGWQSPHARVPVGSTLTLNQDLPIPSGHARVFMQDGRVIPKSAVNIYYPHCNFEVSTVSDGSARILADRFLVTGTRQGFVEVVRAPASSVQVAAVGLVMAGEDSGGPPPMSRLVHYRLHAERQPDVRGLTCHGGMAEEWEAEYPTLDEMRQVLGGLVSLGA